MLPRRMRLPGRVHHPPQIQSTHNVTEAVQDSPLGAITACSRCRRIAAAARQTLETSDRASKSTTTYTVEVFDDVALCLDQVVEPRQRRIPGTPPPPASRFAAPADG